MKVYADTIQELGYKNISIYDNLFNEPLAQACTTLNSISPIPDFIIASPSMEGITLFENASGTSIVNDPYAFSGTCNYNLVYASNDFYLFRFG